MNNNSYKLYIDTGESNRLTTGFAGVAFQVWKLTHTNK